MEKEVANMRISIVAEIKNNSAAACFESFLGLMDI